MSSMTLQPIIRFFCGIVIAVLLASCGQPDRARSTAAYPRVARTAGEFDEVGTVSLYPGESCASQVVFILHSGGSASISLAAPWHQSQVLKDAARSHRKVRVVGKWRHGKTADCAYVEAAQVDLIQKSFW